jgi:hypothetical protein
LRGCKTCDYNLCIVCFEVLNIPFKHVEQSVDDALVFIEIKMYACMQYVGF